MGRARQTQLAYWLIPAQAERVLFSSIIEILAQELDAPVFEPHLTLYTTAQGHTVAKKRLRELEAQSFSLSIREVQFSAAFTKTLFVRFRPSATLNHLVARMQRGAGDPLKMIADPHLSLCYKKLPARSKREIAAAIELPLGKVVFDSLKLVVSPVPIRSADEIKAWRVLTRKKLSD